MKTTRNVVIRLLCLALMSAPAAFAGDPSYATKVIHESDPVLRLSIPASKYMRIVNFIQEGRNLTETSGSFSEITGQVVVYQGAPGSSGARVLLSTLAGTTHQQHEDVIISGPAIVVIAPVPQLTLVFTYLRGSN